MIRLIPDQSRHIVRAAQVTFTFDGAPVAAHRGESVAVALLRTGHLALRRAPGGDGRGLFCCMGLCQDCVVEAHGAVVEACRLPATDGLAVASVRR